MSSFLLVAAAIAAATPSPQPTTVDICSAAVVVGLRNDVKPSRLVDAYLKDQKKMSKNKKEAIREECNAFEAGATFGIQLIVAVLQQREAVSFPHVHKATASE